METGTESAVAIGWLGSKIIPTIAGFFGGLSLAAFWTPEKLREKGKIAAIFMAGSISAGVSFAFTGVVAIWLGVDPNKLDIIIPLAWGLGFFSVAVHNWVVNYIEKTQHKDIMEVGKDIKSQGRQLRKPAVKRAPRKKLK